MLSKKQIFLRCVSMILGLIIGLMASYFTWEIKSYYSDVSSSVSKIDIEKFSKSEFWEKATLHFETSNKVFLDNYMNIYECYGLMNAMDTKLLPYFEKYGYTTMLFSGLSSDNKLANIYCIEKCSETFGEELYDKKEIQKALKNVVIDTNLITNEPNESIYINHAKERLNLLLDLTNETYLSKKISKNALKTRMVWLGNTMSASEKMCIYDNGVFSVIDDINISRNASIHFASDDTIIIDDRSKYAIHLKSAVTVYDIEKIIKDTLNMQDTYIRISSLSCADNKLFSSFDKISDNEHSVSIKSYVLTLDLSSQKADIRESE